MNLPFRVLIIAFCAQLFISFALLVKICEGYAIFRERYGLYRESYFLLTYKNYLDGILICTYKIFFRVSKKNICVLYFHNPYSSMKDCIKILMIERIFKLQKLK